LKRTERGERVQRVQRVQRSILGSDKKSKPVPLSFGGIGLMPAMGLICALAGRYSFFT
jgi:hypothetical protein